MSALRNRECSLCSRQHRSSQLRHDVTNVQAPVFDIRDGTPDAGNIILDVRHDVSNIHPTVSENQSGTENTSPIVADVHRDRLKNRKDANDKNQAVSITRTLTVPSSRSPLPRLTPG